MNIGEAITALKAGKSVNRTSWQIPGARLIHQGSDIHWASDHHPAQPYVAQAGDLLAEDWEAK